MRTVKFVRYWVRAARATPVWAATSLVIWELVVLYLLAMWAF